MKNGLGTVQTAVFFGATSDIGREIISDLGKRGLSTAVLCGRNRDALSLLSHRLEEQYPDLRTSITLFDASQPEPAEQIMADIAATVGDIDLVVLCHGHLEDEHLGVIASSAAIETATVNFTSNISLGLAVAEQFRKQKHGTVVFISTVAGVRVRRSLLIYGAAKRGADSFFRALDHYLEEFDSRSIVVRPGFVKTRMTTKHAVPPFAVDPRQVSEAVMSALDSDLKVVWVPAKLRLVFFVMTHLPERIWRVLNKRKLETHWAALRADR